MSGKKILIVDDDRDFVDAVSTILEGGGYEVLTASDGEEGLRRAKETRPDLIILDLKLPKMNGYEVLNSLKKTSPFCNIPVLMLTVMTKGSRKSDEDWAKSIGVEDFITKPFDPLDILKRVRKLLDVK